MSLDVNKGHLMKEIAAKASCFCCSGLVQASNGGGHGLTTAGQSTFGGLAQGTESASIYNRQLSGKKWLVNHSISVCCSWHMTDSMTCGKITTTNLRAGMTFNLLVAREVVVCCSTHCMIVDCCR